jgi:DNA-binding MarR family transcriptional regulator
LVKIETSSSDLDNEAKITLGLLNMVHDDSSTSQRSMAGDLGIALGLANAYLKRCVKKGLIKVSQAPANRYAYYLTPKGFSEKSRLTAEFLSQSFNLFRRARSDSAELFNLCLNRDWNRIALYGISDLTEIVALSAKDFPIELIAVVDKPSGATNFAGLPVVAEIPNVDDIDAVVICAIIDAQTVYDDACAHFPSERVLFYEFLGVSKASKIQEEGMK